MNNYRFYVGIDTGTNTGMALWDKQAKQFLELHSLPIHRAMDGVRDLLRKAPEGSVYIRVEDARQRKWFGEQKRNNAQGVGSIKRDAVIWEAFLKDLKAEFQMVAPKNNKTKLSATQFKQYTGWTGKTNEHMRDAAMLIFNF